MKAIKSMVHDLFREQNNWKIQLLKSWPTILGSLNAKVHLEKIEDDCLVLGVTDSCWLQELYLLSPILKRAINKKLDAPRIKTLRFKKVGGKKRENKRAAPRKKQCYQQNITLTNKEQRALAQLKDPALKTAMKRFLQRCQLEV